jgi:tRNA(Ile)-lysidine synthase
MTLNSQSFTDHLIKLISPHVKNLSINKPITIWIGFSGGLDSRVLLELSKIALLSLSKQWINYFNLVAVHINHGINKDADFWQEHCYKECQKLQIHFKAIRVNKKFNLSRPNEQSNLEAVLRSSRLEIWKNLIKDGDLILLGHHLNDQVETFFLRLLRGSGVTGLSSIRPVTKIGRLNIIRPLLNNSREQIKIFAQKHQLNYIVDDSNYDQKFARNFLRHAVLPKFIHKWPNYINNITSAIKHLQQVDSFINEQAQVALNDCYIYENYFVANNLGNLVNKNKLSISRLLQNNHFLQAIILRKFLSNQGFYPPSENQLHRIYSEVIYAKIDSQPKLNLRQCIICRYRDELYSYPINYFERKRASFKNVIGNLAIYVGDSISETSLKKVKKIFQKFGIPPWKRYDYPLIFRDQKLIAVLGLWCYGL